MFEEVFVKNPNTLRSPSEIFGTSGRIGDVRATTGHRLENFRLRVGIKIMSNVPIPRMDRFPILQSQI